MSRLQDDLLQAYHMERQVIREQLEILDPLAVTLRKPVAQRLLAKGLLIFFEVLSYLFAVATIFLIVFLDRIYPFYLLHVIRTRDQYVDRLGLADVNSLYFGVAGVLLLLSVLFFIVGRMVRRIRLKNDVLHVAGTQIKTLVGQHLKRKAIFDGIDQRHFYELPMDQSDQGLREQSDEQNPEWKADI